MSLTIKRLGSAVHVLHGADTLPKDENADDRFTLEGPACARHPLL